MLIQKSNSISAILPFSSSAIDNLWRAGQELNGTSIAGVSTGNGDRCSAYYCLIDDHLTRRLVYALHIGLCFLALSAELESHSYCTR